MESMRKVVEGVINLLDPGAEETKCGALIEDFSEMIFSEKNQSGCGMNTCIYFDDCCRKYHTHKKCLELRELLKKEESNC